MIEITALLLYNIIMMNETKSAAEWRMLLAKKEEEPDLEQIVRKRRKRRGKREADFSNLPIEQVVHELPEEERLCPECGGPLHECGHTVLRRELTYIPARYKVVEHVQTAHSCRCCERTNDYVPRWFCRSLDETRGRKAMCGFTAPPEILESQLCCTTTSPAALENVPVIFWTDSQEYCTQTAMRLTIVNCRRKLR